MAGPGRRGPAPKPAEQKRKAGNPGKRKLPAADVELVAGFAAVPAAPEGLGAAGAAAWERIWSRALSWLAPSDVELVRLICEALDDRARLREAVDVLGPVLFSEKGHPMANPAVTELRKLEAQLTAWLSLAGFTPSDRSRLGLSEVKRASKLEELRTRATRPPRPSP